MEECTTSRVKIDKTKITCPIFLNVQEQQFSVFVIELTHYHLPVLPLSGIPHSKFCSNLSE